MSVEAFLRPGIQGHLHRPEQAPTAVVALTHGAGSNCEAPLLVAVADALAEAGYLVLRYNLPYRQQRPSGPPSHPAKKDRDGIRLAASALVELAPGVPLILAGHSYGGRQSSILASEDPQFARGLLLLSYPLHPPKEPEKARTDHFPALRTPALFIHGTRDPFGSIEELTAAIALIPAVTRLIPVQGAAHSLTPSIAATLQPHVSAMLLTS